MKDQIREMPPEIFLDSIEMAAERMARRIISNKPGRRSRKEKSEEEKLKEIGELKSIKIYVLTLKHMLGFMSEESFTRELKSVRGF